MTDEFQPVTTAWIEMRIHVVRGRKVMLDSDLARIYGVPTKRLTEAMRRNLVRFPADFAWRLSTEDLRILRPQFAASSSGWGGRRWRPWVFTEHGALMLGNVLKSPSAVLASVEVVRAFVRLRELVSEHRGLNHRIDELEQRYDIRFKAVFDALRRLLETPRRERGRIGFDLPERPEGGAAADLTPAR